jgi:hypothetical protein
VLSDPYFVCSKPQQCDSLIKKWSGAADQQKRRAPDSDVSALSKRSRPNPALGAETVAQQQAQDFGHFGQYGSPLQEFPRGPAERRIVSARPTADHSYAGFHSYAGLHSVDPSDTFSSTGFSSPADLGDTPDALLPGQDMAADLDEFDFLGEYLRDSSTEELTGTDMTLQTAALDLNASSYFSKLDVSDISPINGSIDNGSCDLDDLSDPVAPPSGAITRPEARLGDPLMLQDLEIMWQSPTDELEDSVRDFMEEPAFGEWNFPNPESLGQRRSSSLMWKKKGRSRVPGGHARPTRNHHRPPLSATELYMGKADSHLLLSSDELHSHGSAHRWDFPRLLE